VVDLLRHLPATASIKGQKWKSKADTSRDRKALLWVQTSNLESVSPARAAFSAEQQTAFAIELDLTGWKCSSLLKHL
jgi:hypothetical protein